MSSTVEGTNAKVRIVADSSCDISSMEGVSFASAPLTISTDERSFRDDGNLDVDEMLDHLAACEGRSYTACPNIADWLACYEGASIIYVVTLSSNISGTYNAAMAAADTYVREHPEAKIRVFDTLSAGPEVRLLVERIAQLVDEGKGFPEVCEQAEEYLGHTRVFFALESFRNFAQNGRVGKTVAKSQGF